MSEEKEFFENSPEEKIKLSLEKILGTKVKFKKTKPSNNDKKREVFIKFINSFINLESKEVALLNDYNLNLSSFTDDYYSVIDLLLDYSFNKTQMAVIFYYLYGRYEMDGKIGVITGPDGNEVNTPEELYDLIVSLK